MYLEQTYVFKFYLNFRYDLYIERERERERATEREREIITYHGTFEVIQSLIVVASKSQASLPCIKLRVINN